VVGHWFGPNGPRKARCERGFSLLRGVVQGGYV
jgi:hypothetical protein